MKIVQTKTVTSLPIQETREEVLSLFRNRKDLHQNGVPNFFVYINEYAWEAFLNHTRGVYKRTRHEGQGIFLGKYFKDIFGEFVVAVSYYEGEGESSHAYVGMSEQCLSEISKKCVAENLLMLIWVHTHPNFGPFYSGTDVNCLKTNFFMPYQTGIVVDIIREEHKGYKVLSGDVFEFKDYSLYNSEQNRLFQPYENKNRVKVNTESIDIKKKEILDVVPPISETILQEVKTIRAELETIKPQIEDFFAETTVTSQLNVVTKELISLNQKVLSLNTDLALIKEHLQKIESTKTVEQMLSSSVESLEFIKIEINSVKKQLQNRKDYSDLLDSLLQELRKKNRLQSIVLIAIFFIIMITSIFLFLK